MQAPDRRTPDETRVRILEVAWDLFRQLGIRATIADVAEKLGMSSANVYRFFPSKQALCESVCAAQLGAITAAARDIATADAPASERIRAILITLYNAMRDQMVNEARVHEIVDVAVRERWAAIDQYEMEMTGVIAGLIAEGQAAGEFAPGDPAELGMLTLCACCGIHHPLLIAIYDRPESPSNPEQIVDFALRALRQR
jgi:AcrR family transcriptional regulator